MCEDNVPVVVIVDELLEIRPLGVFKNVESHKVWNTVAASRYQKEMVTLESHLVPLSPEVEIVFCKHLSNLLNLVVLDDGVGNEVLVLL